ncbi:MAG: hydrogenase nickel incorporation protein HypB [candidate division KSB1 bacterium]|nr:hydrogenase nickel incorporation protein HypB [candidate division KSB1 bacterium]MDZ7274112.1 hydrogenase nickel incorporation protein HypB [candidate division KSB1 bacterium]MDZ7287844.1 hydrogenase nickel incorporation protein HypB [candidate division KSB1 bacterium]MDZ7296710.1 hydrogenase nickel incorporation protein HypB [candidate division KSB1 bacterium]MDZ7309570.1 hydrogenase nickel incorporation protein HypB [candidate division KSB1 bacterium]
MTEKIAVEKKVLSENDKLAAEVRSQLMRHGVVALNLVSSPGSGKTSLLERTLAELNQELRLGLIAGDVQTENDADRLKRAGGRLVQPIVTGGLCHLDAKMITRVLPQFDLAQLDLLFIENVGNLVCPSSYDLGEDMKVVLISTTEGDDKPLKYPAMFRRAKVMVINKIDLLGTSDFDLERAKANARRINADLEIFEVSCRTGAGLRAWFDWLRGLVHGPARAVPPTMGA